MPSQPSRSNDDDDGGGGGDDDSGSLDTSLLSYPSCTRHSFATQWQENDDDCVECDDDNDDGGGDDSDLITTSVNMVTKRPENRSSLVNRLCKRICSEIVLSFFSK